MNKYLLDLDALVPEKKQVKLGGKIYEVNPPTMVQLIALQKTLLSMKDSTTEEQEDAINKVKNIISEIVPGIDGLNLNTQQLQALIEFAYSTNTPQPTEEKKITKK